MKRKLLGFGVAAAMLLAASSATAAGINLGWQNCQSEGGTANRVLACNTNLGTAGILTSSFVLGSDLTTVSGNELVLDFLSATDPYPAWWEFRAPVNCRPLSLGFNTTVSGTNTICLDWASGQATGGVGSYDNTAGSVDPSIVNQHRRLKIALAVPPLALQDLFANQEYFSCNLTVNNLKTVGTGLCDGCLTPMCIVLNSIKVTTPLPANDVILGAGTAPNSNIVTWQGTGPNCQLVPTRNSTWGAVKSLYR